MERHQSVCIDLGEFDFFLIGFLFTIFFLSLSSKKATDGRTGGRGSKWRLFAGHKKSSLSAPTTTYFQCFSELEYWINFDGPSFDLESNIFLYFSPMGAYV